VREQNVATGSRESVRRPRIARPDRPSPDRPDRVPDYEVLE
jgi:hypothetical protein